MNRRRRTFNLTTGHTIAVRRPPEAQGYDFETHQWFACEWEITVWFPLFPGVSAISSVQHEDGTMSVRYGESFTGNTLREAMAKVREAYDQHGESLSWDGVLLIPDGSLVLPVERTAALLPKNIPPAVGKGAFQRREQKR